MVLNSDVIYTISLWSVINRRAANNQACNANIENNADSLSTNSCTWIEYFLSLGVTGTEGAVQLEVIGIMQEWTSQWEQDPLQKIWKIMY